MSSDPDTFKYHRILLKVSGESLAGDGYGINPDTCIQFVREIAILVRQGAQIALVCGGGNIFRGIHADRFHLNRTIADQMGMLATIINGLALKEFFRAEHIPAETFSALPISGVVSAFNIDNVLALLENGGVSIFTAGTGQPFFSTDTASALRALQIKADIFVKGTKVDGVYDCDPIQNPDAIFYPHLDYQTAMAKNLRVMDQTAVALCRENQLPVLVMNLTVPGRLAAAINGDSIGTLIS